MNRYLLKKEKNEYVIIDKFPPWTSGKKEVVIERFDENDYDLAKETFDIYIDEEKNNKFSQLNRKESK